MKNIWHLFVNDLMRLKSNVVTTIIVLGLVLLPSIFSWYNVLACWDAFGNTGSLKVAVANCDEGYEGDLVPIRMSFGDQVVSALRANDQLDWVFTDKEDAVEGARGGRYYAAVVIPESFSRDMMSFYSSEVEHAQITYYSNQKRSAIAPKVTDQGADRISHQVNQVFAKTLSELAIGLSTVLLEYTDESDFNGLMGKLAAHASEVGADMDEAAEALDLYSSVLTSTLQLMDHSDKLLAKARQSAEGIAATASGVQTSAQTVSAALEDTTAALSQALGESEDSFKDVPAALDSAFASASTLGADVSRQLRAEADDITQVAGDYQNVADALEAVRDRLPDETAKTACSNVVAHLDASAASLRLMGDELASSANNLDDDIASAQKDRADAERLAQEATDSLAAAKDDYDRDLKPALDELARTLGSAAESIQATKQKTDEVNANIGNGARSLANQLRVSRGQLVNAADTLRQSASDMKNMGLEITSAVARGDVEALREFMGSNPDALAQAISAPVKLERHAVYPVETFGSAMAPLYTTLALWIGALVVMVTLRVVPSRRSVEELDDPTPRQLFLGRFGVISVISLLQSTIVCLGNMLFLGVQVNDPLLYVLCFWVSGLVFAFIIYTLVALFANFGKALSVILLIVQVAGGGGSFPLGLLPPFFQNMSPYLPITHAVNAMRSAMFGVFENDFWIQLGQLALFVVPFIVLGLVLNKPLSIIVPRFVERVERSKLM